MIGRMSMYFALLQLAKNLDFFPYEDKCEKSREQLKFYFFDKV